MSTFQKTSIQAPDDSHVSSRRLEDDPEKQKVLLHFGIPDLTRLGRGLLGGPFDHLGRGGSLGCHNESVSQNRVSDWKDESVRGLGRGRGRKRKRSRVVKPASFQRETNTPFRSFLRFWQMYDLFGERQFDLTLSCFLSFSSSCSSTLSR